MMTKTARGLLALAFLLQLAHAQPAEAGIFWHYGWDVVHTEPAAPSLWERGPRAWLEGILQRLT